MKDLIRKRFEESQAATRQAGELLVARIERAAGLIAACCKAGGCVFTLGNGGSATDALHIACELVGRFAMERKAFRAEALTADVATMTSVANDYGFESVFARQIEGKARTGDVVIGLSTSGNSPNVVAALAKARQLGCKTIAMTGRGGGKCTALADVLLDVLSNVTPRVQEVHSVIYHIICELVEAALAGGGK